MKLESCTLIKQGAEAKLYLGEYLGHNVIVKERFVKNYRHPDLDKYITKERIKAECKAIVKCKAANIKTPTIYLVQLTKRLIVMEYFEGSTTVKDFINSTSDVDVLDKLSIKIGSELGKMHSHNIIHGDLTSSNMLVLSQEEQLNANELELVFIDFGLAHIDSKAEDKGVDLYVLERALLSTHAVAKNMFPKILQGYKLKNKGNSKEVMNKFEEVRARGRKRTMVG